MKFMEELKRLARPYEDEEVVETPEEEFTPVSREPSYPRDSYSREPYSREPYSRDSYSRDSCSREGYSREGYSREGDRRGNKVVNIHTTTQLQVVLVKPERFENASEIADHLRDKRTVVLNLEQTDKNIARRLIDFLSGVAYANEGTIKKVAVSTYIITPYNVEILGDLIDELENNGLYF